MASLQKADLDRFRNLVGRHLGLQFDNGKRDLLVEILRQRLEHHRCASPAAYLTTITSSAPEEWRVLAAQLTVTETYFFRGSDQFRVLAETVLPDRIRTRRGEGRLRILSAGCASGEEPYSVAILLRERFPELATWKVEILGLDLNPLMIAKAHKAVYHAWPLRDTPPEIQEKYFQKAGTDLVLDDRIRSMVSFEEGNLASADLARIGEFDVILCRNVVMYLVPDAAQSVISGLTQALLPHGFLFLGYAETLRGLSQDFHLRHTHETFYYQKRLSTDTMPERAHSVNCNIPGTSVDPQDVGWVDAVQRASERIESLSRGCLLPSPEPHARDATVRTAMQNGHSPLGIGFALELLRQEKFREALEVLHRFPRETRDDPDAQLLQAALLINCGDLDRAEKVCGQILRVDDLNAGAHYLSALCREHAGDPSGALEHDRAAIYLDAAFAMPHLHLGRMAKRSADVATARHELEHACALLSREDPSRLLLFGGGFSREALLSFGRNELRACGGGA